MNLHAWGKAWKVCQVLQFIYNERAWTGFLNWDNSVLLCYFSGALEETSLRDVSPYIK